MKNLRVIHNFLFARNNGVANKATSLALAASRSAC
jgi:hypothetical protein